MDTRRCPSARRIRDKLVTHGRVAGLRSLASWQSPRKEFAMCPLCIATTGLYLAGGLSAGAVTTFLAVKLLPTKRNISNETEGDEHAATNDRIEK
jgi:hypothetical protein